MVGTTERQWYRLSTQQVLEVVQTDINTGVSSVAKRQVNKPIFLPKTSWNLYHYRTLRKSVWRYIPIHHLVMGDVIQLCQGDIVPATLRMLATQSVAVYEPTINDASEITYKQTLASTSILALNQQKNMLFAGSEILSGSAKAVVVAPAQAARYVKKASNFKQNRTLQNSGLVVQKPSVHKSIVNCTSIVLDDIQQVKEVIDLIQRIALSKQITTIFFVPVSVTKQLENELPRQCFNPKNDSLLQNTLAIYSDVSDASKYIIVKELHKQGPVMYVHRGQVAKSAANTATVNMVIAPKALQVALQRADVIAPKLSTTTLASILYNKK